MAIKRMDEVLAAIAAGKSNAEIRDEIDGRIGDKAINQLRKHPANADVPWPEDALKAEADMKARAEAAAAEDKVPFTPAEPEENAPEEPVQEKTDEDEGPQLPECVTAMLEETDPPMSVAEAIRELALYALTDDPDHLIAAALAVKTRMHKLNRRIKR